jgi:hypothetical protein
MTKEDAVSAFGTQMALAKALGITQGTIAGWDKVPVLRQLQIEALTDGRLKADPECEPFKVQAA